MTDEIEKNLLQTYALLSRAAARKKVYSLYSVDSSIGILILSNTFRQLFDIIALYEYHS